MFHPGEYGKYREEIVRNLFRNILYEDLDISEGFLINNQNQHSTQCDVIVYDSKKTPILKENNKLEKIIVVLFSLSDYEVYEKYLKSR